ncbi:MAG: ABC transporter permease [Bacteroidales bacterium]|nr:ABC transporter permease [Bacteroidales bacterium]
MNKIRLIILREYLTRVKKKSFIIMTILGPLLIAGIIIIRFYIAQMEGETRLVGIVDESGLYADKFQNTDNINFRILNVDIESAKKILGNEGFYAILHIPKTELSMPQSAVVYSDKQPNIVVTGYIRNTLRKEIENLKLQASGIDPDVLASIKTSVNLFTVKIKESGEEKEGSTELSMIVGLFSGIFIYFFIFMYGTQVMRGVIEEKTSRIIEVIISSVKPFQLLIGKIIGLAMVGLTQFAIWIILSFSIVTIFLYSFAGDIEDYNSSQFKIQNKSIEMLGTPEINAPSADVNESVIAVYDSIKSINFGVIIMSFLFFFISGYLIYSALFAAIGSASDVETDTQQFILPITLPLIFSMVISFFLIENPDGQAAFWLSIFPLTSPVVMMIRIPFGVPYFDLYLSMALMVLGFLGATWLAAKIYRTGILMYGKKITYKELWKWIRYN